MIVVFLAVVYICAIACALLLWGAYKIVKVVEEFRDRRDLDEWEKEFE